MKKDLKESPEESASAESEDRRSEEERRAAEQISVDLMEFRRGVSRRLSDGLPGHLAVRVPVLIGLVVVLMTWLQRHKQWPIDDLLKWGGGALVTYSFALPWIQRAFSRHRDALERGFAEVVVVYLGFLLRTPVLLALFLVVLIPNLFYSSVTVVAAGVPGERAVVLQAVDSKGKRDFDLTGEDSTHTFNGLNTSPLGARFILNVAGFEAVPFTLFPGVGRQFLLKELPISPAIIVRLPPEHADSINDTGVVLLFRRTEEQALELIGRTATRELYGSYVFGWYKGDLSEFASGWEDDLAANQKLVVDIKDEGDPLKMSTADFRTVRWIWKQSVRADFVPGREPRPRDQVEAYLLKNGAEGLSSLAGHVSFVVSETPDSVQNQMLLGLLTGQADVLKESLGLKEAVAGALEGTE